MQGQLRQLSAASVLVQAWRRVAEAVAVAGGWRVVLGFVSGLLASWVAGRATGGGSAALQVEEREQLYRPLRQLRAQRTALVDFRRRELAVQQQQQQQPRGGSARQREGQDISALGGGGSGWALPPGIWEPATDLTRKNLEGNPYEDKEFRGCCLLSLTLGEGNPEQVRTVFPKFSRGIE